MTVATHECMVSVCREQVEERWAICGGCFRRLPEDIVLAIRRAYGVGMTVENMSIGLRRAIIRADSWLREFLGGEDRRGPKYDPGTWERLCRMVRERDAARARIRAAMEGRPDAEKVAAFRHLRLVP